jgi:hypothetical protein
VKYIAPYGVNDPDAPYHNGDPSLGRAGSIPPAAAFEHHMRELVHMISKCKLTPTDQDFYQLFKSVRTNYVNWALDTGTANNLVCVFDPVLEAYNNGLVVRIKVKITNTGPSQIDCGPGFRDIVRIDRSPLAGGDMPAGGIACLCYVDTEFQLLNPSIANAGIVAPPSGAGDVITHVTNRYNGLNGMVGWDKAGTYDWTVPDGVLRIYLRLWAGGGPGVEWAYGCPPHWGIYIKGGDGGYVEGIFPVVPKTLMRAVIGTGAAPPNPEQYDSRGGWYMPFDSNKWKNVFGQPSSFGVAGQPPMCTAGGGRGCYINPPGDADASPGENGTGTGGAINRSNGVYGRGGGGYQTSDGVHNLTPKCTGDPGAAIILY